MKQRISKWVAGWQTGLSKRTRASQFAKLVVHPGDIVFLGDSITEGGIWNEWFPGAPIRNRGIAGDTSEEVRARLSAAVPPGTSAVFLLAGTNDVTLSVPDEEILRNITEILRTLRATSPATTVFLQSIMPRRRNLAERLVELNKNLEHIASQEDATFVDLWPALSDGAGAINPDFSLDHIHLTGAGYACWVAVLRPHLETVLAASAIEP